MSAGVIAACASFADGQEVSPEGRALAYLAREVRRWRPENKCFSCHHNGDATRALIAGRNLGYSIPPSAMRETLEWLERPEVWEDNGGKGPFSDKRLARLQFSAALLAAVESRGPADRAPLLKAADRLTQDQAEDGSWPGDGGDSLGSPATYGRALSTALAREFLRAANSPESRDRVARADEWLEALSVASVPDAAAVLLVHDSTTRAGRLARDWLTHAQAPDGGWGPYAGSPSEPFDTALALLALAKSGVGLPEDSIRRGRSALIASQLLDGSWSETTRPAGSESYAQKVSTTAWATLALLATGDRQARLESCL
jgi:squalene cyclase